MQYTLADKELMYKRGQYVFHAPPVSHDQWTDHDWIRYIDSCDGWRPMGVYGTGHKEVIGYALMAMDTM